MPDEFGFNWLGDKRLCIEKGCDGGGWSWEWPEDRRREHYREHQDVRRKANNDAAAARLAIWRGGQRERD